MTTTTTPLGRSGFTDLAAHTASVGRAATSGRLGLTGEVGGVWDVLEMISTSRICGDEPYAATARLAGVAALENIAPASAPTRSIITDDNEKWLVIGDEWTFFGVLDRDGDAYVVISASRRDRCRELLAEVRSKVAPVVPDDDTIPIAFWYCEQRPQLSHRRVAAPTWEAIEQNYPEPVRRGVAATMDLCRPSGNGRLLLWHGPPGTGKTTATRALARRWSSWCRTTVVTEPERLLSSTGMIFHLLSPDDDDRRNAGDADASPRWHLLVIEDADELLRSDARSQSGQALSRLLNVADGFIGQGLDVLVLLSTNEPLSGLHPAVARPGRCLSHIEFPRFGRADAARWLGRDLPAGTPDASLAELVRARDGGEPAAPASFTESGGTGQYL